MPCGGRQAHGHPEFAKTALETGELTSWALGRFWKAKTGSLCCNSEFLKVAGLTQFWQSDGTRGSFEYVTFGPKGEFPLVTCQGRGVIVSCGFRAWRAWTSVSRALLQRSKSGNANRGIQESPLSRAKIGKHLCAKSA